MRNNCCYFLFIYFFRILFVEDTIFFVTKSNTAKTILTGITVVTIIEILTSFLTSRYKCTVICFVWRQSFIGKDWRTTLVYIKAVLCLRIKTRYIFCMLYVQDIKAIDNVLRMKNIVPDTIGTIPLYHCFFRIFLEMISKHF